MVMFYALCVILQPELGSQRIVYVHHFHNFLGTKLLYDFSLEKHKNTNMSYFECIYYFNLSTNQKYTYMKTLKGVRKGSPRNLNLNDTQKSETFRTELQIICLLI